MYISEKPEYEEETVMLIEEFLKQRIAGMKNEYDVIATQTFPKLLYFLDENNTYEGSKYFWLTKLAVESTAIRMNPDFISVKKMKELIGYAFPPMGCRAFLSPFINKDGEAIFYGRGNLGVTSINLPHVALSSKGDIDKFWAILDERLEMCREMCNLRYNKLRGVKADVAPILWQHGAISRLKYNDDIIKAIDERGFTVTIGYSGLYETVKYLTGKSHTSKEGFELAEKIMKYLRDKCEEFKEAQPHLRFALYGTPQESTTGWFSDRLLREFGEIKDITDKGFITNSYHVDVREEIDAFTKLEVESILQAYSTGGAVSYIETYNMHKNLEALLQIVQYMYETIIYAEVNFESDVCGQCKYTGTMDNDPKTLEWVCPQCGNRDQNTLGVVRRTCGYLGETIWTEGRKLDILNRVKHL
jgi:ribonucleoside-triphosphate reductase